MSAPFVHPETPRVAVPCGCELGEGALWDHRTASVLWVDINGHAVWRYEPASGATHRLEVAEPVGFVLLTPDPGVVIAGFRSGLVRLNLADGAVSPIPSAAQDDPRQRLNDGVVGPDGSIYFGTMDAAEKESTGGFWRWRGGRVTHLQGGLRVPNGPAIDPARRVIYMTNTHEGLIFAHDLDDEGRPGPGRLLIRFEPGWGHPDGMAIDDEGHLWCCHFGGSRITRFTPNGRVERLLPVPTAQVTKCAFGGPDLTTLFITTAARGRDPHLDPMAGHLFAVETGVVGLTAELAA